MARSKRRGPKKGGKDEPSRTDVIEKLDMDNERFKTYYQAQRLVPEEEWETFYDALKQHLPTTFRVAGSRQVANTLNQTIKDVHVPALSDVIFEEQKIPPPVQIPWYPDGLAWQFNVPKKVLRKSPEFKKFHSFLVFETEVGNISRQEAVSMLPPLFLEVEPHHRVMDMCAAPGSKTAQLLEALHAQDSVTATSIPSGLLIANDTDHKRTHLLIHQTARLPSPALMVTNLDASIYPVMKIDALPGPNGERRTEQLLFDRILCDVPCSGDGTLRKNMGIWKSWQPMDGNGLHGLQVRILQRAMKLLKPDGRIVYSTCSLNPVENEAVLAEALKSNSDFHLVDVSSKLPSLIRRPGLTSWRPSVDRSVNTSYATYEEFVASETAKANPNTKLTEGHWPPKDVERFDLHRSMRIYPHLQDTGGFFVAVLERRPPGEQSAKKREASESEEPAETKKPRLEKENVAAGAEPVAEPADIDVDVENAAGDASEAKTKETPTSTSAAVAKGRGSKRAKKDKETDETFKEHPYTFLSPDDPILKNCIERLSLTSDFPSSNILVRNPEGEAVRSLYLANDLVKSVVEHNNYTRIRLSAAGTKVFSKQDMGKATVGGEPQFRVLGEGLPVILPFVDPGAIITADLETLKVLVQSYYPLVSSFEEPFKSVMEARAIGSHVVRFPPGEFDGAVLTHEIVLPIWKSNVSLTLMMDKKAKSALSLRLFGADITTAGRDVAQKQAGAESGSATPGLPPTAGDEEADTELAVVQESDLLDAMEES
ncbi:putative class I-like SAM-binding methyltransferase superfamily, RsmB NOP family protein [Lyophyllum shimeji]|uniref:Class I-like SAM-binding methyltransferase superfamily, RsmB NOP family protein n=1 Tax=Lyophyllum shimeji TaxID=47721 RepID=A0A9P3PPL7_LYOSH|nr:putative class I-like SAM-binding methyltransferase superfamily, RsmB NOP family protein [Lyophyllum shimeji]